MNERKKITEKKQESANILRLKGNNYFKLKKFDKALEFYYDAMKESPFDSKLVNNIAQVKNIFILLLLYYSYFNQRFVISLYVCFIQCFFIAVTLLFNKLYIYI